MSDKLTYNGSRWWKIDFHVHTPASSDYKNKSIEPEEWLKNAMNQKLDAVVVTDHNSGEWINLLKEKNEQLKKSDYKPEWYRELVIFPGVEITVESNYHLLAVFDPSCSTSTIASVLGACGISSNFGNCDTSATASFIDAVKTVQSHGGIAIPAHIDGVKGFLDVNKVKGLNDFQKKVLKNITVAQFNEPKSFENYDKDFKNEIEKLTAVQGSDAHSPEEIGKKFSWIKLGKASIDGLNLAFRGGIYCTSNEKDDPNYEPDFYIKSLQISKMLRCGRLTPFLISFNPHFNSIIGGRGSGKSTIVESMRIVSRNEKNLEIEAPKLKTEFDNFIKKYPDGVMLEDSELTLELSKNDINYELLWNFSGKGSSVKIKIVGNESDKENSVEESHINELFPISIYSQKQIYELASNPAGLLSLIDRSMDVNIAEWDSKWKNKYSEFLRLRIEKRELERQLSEIKKDQVMLSELNLEIDSYESQNYDIGEILNHYQKFNLQQGKLPNDEIFINLIKSLQSVLPDFDSPCFELPDFSSNDFDDDSIDELTKIFDKHASKLKQLKNNVQKIIDDVTDLRVGWLNDLSVCNWKKKFDDARKKYLDLETKLQSESKETNPVQRYSTLLVKRSNLFQKITKGKHLQSEINRISGQIAECLDNLYNLRLELFNKRTSFIDRIIGKNKFVKMEIKQFGDVSSVESKYRELLNFEPNTFSNSIYNKNENSSETNQGVGILSSLIGYEGTDIDVINQKVSALKSETIKIAKGDTKKYDAKFIKRLSSLLQEHPENFDKLEAWWPDDLLVVKYFNGKKYENLSRGSAGQKSAAVLAFLLSYGDWPLIMDQPEDDLDNSLIYDLIVRQIQENKKNRQIIIATHNPNIVVNGDSELVFALNICGGQIQIANQGSLEEFAVRDSICTIMEGGEQAFENRYKKIILERKNNV